MDLGISGKSAVVCGSSAGLGYACAEALAREGARVALVARDAARLASAASRLQAATGTSPAVVAADVATSEGRAAIFAACPEPEILITNAGGPERKDFRELSVADWYQSLDSNFIASVEMIRQALGPMTARGWGRVVNITSLTARMSVEGMDRSTSARLALAGYVAGVARQVASQGVTINNLLPGTFATERLAEIGTTANALIARVPMKRPGKTEEFGATCAFMCSTHAAYMTGQNILVDGGLCPITI